MQRKGECVRTGGGGRGHHAEPEPQYEDDLEPQYEVEP
jgi:hypothetical protein